MEDEIKLVDALKLPPNEPCKRSVHVNVMERGQVTTYKDSKRVCEAVVADDSECCRVFIYDEHILQLFIQGSGLIISDFIVKPGFLVVTRMTEVFGSSVIVVAEDIVTRSKNLMGHVMKVLEASTSPKKTPVKSVEGIVVKVSPTEMKRKRTTQEEIAFKRAKLRDESGSIEVCLWRQLATTNLTRGDHVKLINFEVTECLDSNSRQTPAVCNKTSRAAIEILPVTDKFNNLLDLPEDLHEDDGPVVPASTIIGFGPINVYTSCPNETCYKKKVLNFKCPKCGITYSSATVEESVNGTMKIKGKAGQLNYFTQHAIEMAKQLEISNKITDGQFLQELIKNIPITAKIQTRENKVLKIQIIK